MLIKVEDKLLNQTLLIPLRWIVNMRVERRDGKIIIVAKDILREIHTLSADNEETLLKLLKKWEDADKVALTAVVAQPQEEEEVEVTDAGPIE